MSADPFKTLRDRQLEYQAEPVVLVDPATGEAGAIRLSGSIPVRGADGENPASAENPLPVVGVDEAIGSLKILSSATTVNASSSESVLAQPAEGKVWIVQGMQLQASAPSGATTGNHDFVISLGAGGVPLAQGRSTYNKQIRYQYQQWRDETGATLSAEVPSDKAAQLHLVRGLLLTNATPLQILYINNTDAAQADSRIIRLSVIEVPATSIGLLL